jgi:hypothetical protein
MLLLFTRYVLMLRSIFVGAPEVFFSSGSMVLINLIIDIFYSLIGCAEGVVISVLSVECLLSRILHPMTDDEKDIATQRRLESPPQCDYRDHVVIGEDTAKYFACPNIDYVSA